MIYDTTGAIAVTLANLAGRNSAVLVIAFIGMFVVAGVASLGLCFPHR